MKKAIFSLLIFLVMTLSNFGNSQCQYSFASFNQTVSVNGDPAMTSVNTLSTCTEYVFDYSIGFSSIGLTSVTDDITIELPFNISFQSLVSSNGTVTVNSSTGNTVSLNVSGWNISNTLQIELIGIPSVCDAATITGSSLAELDGTLACGSINSPNSVTIVAPHLYVDDISAHNQNNIGDVDEIVFLIQNTSGNGALIQNVLVDYNLNSVIESYNNTYYLSGSATVGAGNNIYTYVLPGSIFTAAIPASTIPIDPADFQNVLGHGYLADNEAIYLHIPYFVKSCTGSSGSTGDFTFKRDCGNSITCDSQLQQHNISVISGGPYIGSGNVIPLHDENATFCAAAGGQDMDLGWRLFGSNANPTGGPVGYTRVTDLQLLFLVDNSFGTANPSTFTISNGSSSINVGTYVETVSTSFLMLGGATTATVYKIHLENLPVPAVGSWQPLGANSLSDLDGDGFVDDLIEFGSFDIHVDYAYSTTCPLNADQGMYYTIAMMQWAYKDACYVPATNSAVGGNVTWYQDNCGYGYTATGAGGELNLPPDILSNEPFVSELCFAPYTEEYSMNGLVFDCPNGFHRVIYEVPNGYHLDLSGLTASTSQPGWYELPDMTVTSVAGPGNPTQQVSPIVQEYCNPGGSGRIIEVRFGLIPSDLLYFARPFTMQLPCLDLPMYLDCSGSDPACPGLPNNFGFDDLDFRLEFVCDESCSTCSSYIVGGHASTYHHCPGLCESYFGTDPHPEFKRTNLGFVNTASGYIMGSDLTDPSDLITSTEPTINLSAAYPGDQILLAVNGSFDGTPGITYTPNTGASYDDIYLQVRYDDLPAGERKEARLFDLEQLAGDGITITENSPVNGVSSYLVPVSDLVMTDFVSLGVVYLNINLSGLGLSFIDESNATYTFSSNLHLRVRSEPFSSTNHFFYSYGAHKITSLRFEYKGTETGGTVIDGSCDDYGANFKILQPNAGVPIPTYVGEGTYCGPTEVNIRFYNDAALYAIANDFPNEYHAYAQLGAQLEVIIPAGYNYVGAYFFQDGKVFDSSDPNNFEISYIPGGIHVPITPVSVTNVSGTTHVQFNGIDPTDPDPSWPALDLESGTGSQYIFLKLIPSCGVPQHSEVTATGEYTIGVNQDLPDYQLTVPFDYVVPLSQYSPNINIINPTATVNAYDGTAEFTFSVCNDNLLMTGPANQAWFAFENSSIDGLDLTNATLINTATNTPVTFTTYTNSGHQGIIANVGLISPQACMSFKLTTHVSANGCVSGNSYVADFITVFGGNSCDGSILTSPVEECTKEVTQFDFNRYPSDLELILPEDAYPTDAVEMCNGILEYNFILNSYEIGAVNDVQFWLDLPNGLSLDNITFSNPGGTPTSYTTSSYDGTTYGAGGNLSGWDVLPHLTLPNLPGSLSTNNQILVHLEVQSSCDYDLASPVLCYANSINSCGQETSLLEMSSLPLISNATLANDLVITPVITFSDDEDTLSCDNVATVTLTITNNSDVSNLTDFNVTAMVPGSPLIVDPGTGTLTGNEVVWNIPTGSVPANSSITVSYTITNPGILCQNDVPMSAVIDFSQDVSCTSSGGSCDVTLTTDTVYFDIDVCCSCALDLTMSSEPVYCKASPGSATVLVSGAVGTVTYLWSDGQTTATATNLFQGTYTVTVTDENGCTKTDTVTVGWVNNPLVITATPDQNPICEGESVSITPGGGSVYSLTDGISLELTYTGVPFVVTPTSTTTYIVYGSDKLGCYGDTTVTITVKPNVEPTFKVQDNYCSGAAIPALPTTSLNGITGTWSPAIDNTTTTTYTFTPDSGQCATTTTITITIVPAVTPTFTAAGPYCSGATIPALPTTSNNGISGTWSPAIDNTTTTTYTFTPAEGQCATTTTLDIRIREKEIPVFKKIGTTYCIGSTPGTLPTTSTNGITGTWSPSVINTSAAGITTYTFTPTAGQCATTFSITVTILAPTTPTFTAVGPYCAGASISALPTTSTNGIAGTWSPAINNTATTTYTFTPSGSQCATTTTMQIEIKPNVTPTFTQLGPYCKNSTPGTLPTTSLNGITGTWSPSAISTTAAGTITYTFTPTAGQCATTATMNIVVTSAPTISVTNTNPIICEGVGPTSTTLTAVVTPSTGVTYSWSPGGATTSGITVTPVAIGSQIYTVTASVGGCTVTASTTVAYNKRPSISVSPATATICNGSNVTLTASGTTGSIFGWGPAAGLNTTSGSVVIASPTSTTTYTVTGTLNGCSSSATSTVTVNPLPTISGTSSACMGGSTVTFTGTPSGGVWSSTIPTVATVTTPGGIVTPSSSNTGTTNITYTNSVTGCVKQQAFTVNPLPLAPSINSGATTLQICTGDYGTLSSTPYTSGVVWTPGSTASPSIVIPAPSVSPTTYTATYTNPTTGCKSSTSIAVSKVTCTQPGHCLLTANFTSSVSGSTCDWTFTSTSTAVLGTIASPGTGYTFNWTVSSSTGALITTGTGFTYALSSLVFPGAGTYTVCLTVTRTGTNPVCMDQICKTISVSCTSGMVISNNNNHLVSKFEAKGESQDVLDNLDYWWSFGDGTFSSEAKPEHNYAKPGTYEVCLRNGAMSDDLICRTITVSDDEVETGVVPILSVNPNPTSGQTTVLLDGAENRTVEIKLYNMLGEEVTTLFTKTCCNDTMIRLVWNSEEVPPGVYLIKAQVDSKTMVEKIVVSSH